MRRTFTKLCVLCLVTFTQPLLASEFSEVRHLLARTGFDPSLQEIQKLLPLSYSDAVNKLLSNRSDVNIPSPSWVNKQPNQVKGKDITARKARQKQRRQQGNELKVWWYQRMIETTNPMHERMTLFWHNHFTSSLKKVKSPKLMYQQNVLLREHALGNFADLLHAVAEDPAMVIYLDNVSNKKSAPNENFARELLELFTLGEGHYSEQDIKQAARAFTGYSVNRKTGEFAFRQRLHDSGSKTFLGQTGRWKGNDIIDILLQQPETANTIIRKLWLAFVSDKEDSQAINKIAKQFRQSNYDIKTAMRALLMHNEFRNKSNRGNLIKSPVELTIGILRNLGIPKMQRSRFNKQLINNTKKLGQDIFFPPNVKGWSGGTNWIDSNTLILRRQFIQRLTRGANDMRNSSLTEISNIDRATAKKVLLPIEPVHQASDSMPWHNWLSTLLLDPAYQLK